MRPPLLYFAAICGFVVLSPVDSPITHAQTSLALTALQSDEPLGSTMTLEQMQQRSKKVAVQEMEEVHRVEPSGEPVPALKYRLYPAKWELKPGSALMHYNRAIIAFLQLSVDQRLKLQSPEWISGTGDGSKPTVEELGKVIRSLEFIFDELHELALSEDFSWDHQLRHMKGLDVYMYRLNDVQEIRSFARLLQLRIRYQLLQADFDGALSSVADGIRLAEFVGQGETLIHKLVGIGIQSMMRQSIIKAIETPGCPNLYWALATIPRPLNKVSESVSWELNNISRVLPALAEAETANWSNEQAADKWQGMVNDLVSLGNDNSSMVARTAIAVVGVSQADQAKQHLLGQGVPKERVDSMPGLQSVLAMTAWELRKIGQDLQKAHLLPSIKGRQMAAKEQEIFDSFGNANRTSSLAAIISRLLFPAVQNAFEAEVRIEMNYHRLMTLEALRIHVDATGKLPKRLEDLKAAPAFPDPYTGQPFEYTTRRSPNGTIVTLKTSGMKNYPPLQVLNVQFAQ